MRKAARDVYALLFTARQLARLVRQALAQSDLVQQRLGLCACPGSRRGIVSSAQGRGDLLRELVFSSELRPRIPAEVLDRFQSEGLVDDRAFAESFGRERLRNRPVGPR